MEREMKRYKILNEEYDIMEIILISAGILGFLFTVFVLIIGVVVK
jgi:hypothetical protein